MKFKTAGRNSHQTTSSAEIQRSYENLNDANAEQYKCVLNFKYFRSV